MHNMTKYKTPRPSKGVGFTPEQDIMDKINDILRKENEFSFEEQEGILPQENEEEFENHELEKNVETMIVTYKADVMQHAFEREMVEVWARENKEFEGDILNEVDDMF